MLGDHNLSARTFAYERLRPHSVHGQCAGLAGERKWYGQRERSGAARRHAHAARRGRRRNPRFRDGSSLLPLMRGEDTAWRDYLHGEHLGTYRPEDAMQYLTDGKEKYIWYTVTGAEQLFNLVDDPQECRNLAPDPNHQDRLMLWRSA